MTPKQKVDQIDYHICPLCGSILQRLFEKQYLAKVKCNCGYCVDEINGPRISPQLKEAYKTIKADSKELRKRFYT